MQNFLTAAIAFAIGSFVSSTAFYQILPELRDIKNEKSIGSVLTCIAWIVAMVAGVIFAFKFGTTVGGFAIVGIVSGLMTTFKMIS
ncbi:MAG: hypothetical protein IKJ99_06185 [Oscillospiraceae bacterium]|nr:hypothetical protein [Oscillospiraceae bacterium]